MYLEDTSFIHVIPKDMQVKTYITLNFFEYCTSACDMYKNIINYNKSVKIRSCHDIIPSMLKCNIFTKDLIKNGFLNNLHHSDILKQTVEINNLIFTKYIIFKKVEKIKVNYFVSKIKSVCSVAIHIRYDDICMNDKICNISSTMMNGYINLIKEIKKCNIHLASSNIKLIKLLKMKFGSRIIEYLPGIKPAHSNEILTYHHKNKSNSISDKIRKIIGDIYFLSNSDRFILSSLSTFSLMIYYIGAKNLNGSIKPMKIISSDNGKIDKLQIYDHLNYFAHRKRMCKPSPFSNLLTYPYYFFKFKKNDYKSMATQII